MTIKSEKDIVDIEIMPAVPAVPQPQPQTQPPAPPAQGKKWMGSIKTVLFALASIGLSIALVGLGYWYAGRTTTSPVVEKAPVSSSAPVSETTTFTGEKLGISFEYPSEWGTAVEEIKPIGDAQNYHGYNYHLTFSHNPYLSVVGASQDSSSPGVGGACPIRQFFKGTQETGVLSCSQCQTESEGCGGCQNLNLGGQSAVSYLYKPTASCGILGFQKVVYLTTPYNNNESDFPGLVLVLNIASNDDGQLADLSYRSGAGCVGESEEQQQQRTYLTNLYNDLSEKLNSSLLSSQSSSYLTQSQLTEFETFLSSIQFTK